MPEPTTSGTRHASRVLTSAAQWRTEVSSQLVALQTGLAGLDAALNEDRKQRQESPRAWLLAVIMFCCSLVLVVIGIQKGLAASADAATASRLQAQAVSTTDQAGRAALSKACNEPAGTLAFLECVAADQAALTHAFFVAADDEAKSERYQNSANQLRLLGPAALAFGSALTGAVLGWILTQWLARYSRRSSRNRAGER